MIEQNGVEKTQREDEKFKSQVVRKLISGGWTDCSKLLLKRSLGLYNKCSDIVTIVTSTMYLRAQAIFKVTSKRSVLFVSTV